MISKFRRTYHWRKLGGGVPLPLWAGEMVHPLQIFYWEILRILLLNTRVTVRFYQIQRWLRLVSVALRSTHFTCLHPLATPFQILHFSYQVYRWYIQGNFIRFFKCLHRFEVDTISNVMNVNMGPALRLSQLCRHGHLR